MSLNSLPRRKKSLVATVMIALSVFIGLFVLARWRRSV